MLDTHRLGLKAGDWGCRVQDAGCRNGDGGLMMEDGGWKNARLPVGPHRAAGPKARSGVSGLEWRLVASPPCGPHEWVDELERKLAVDADWQENLGHPARKLHPPLAESSPPRQEAHSPGPVTPAPKRVLEELAALRVGFQHHDLFFQVGVSGRTGRAQVSSQACPKFPLRHPKE